MHFACLLFSGLRADISEAVIRLYVEFYCAKYWQDE